jgi:hypothetical protein
VCINDNDKHSYKQEQNSTRSRCKYSVAQSDRYSQEIKVIVANLPGCDILIGMDIIGMGDFAVSNYNGRIVFSFRVPSMAEIDFCI